MRRAVDFCFRSLRTVWSSLRSAPLGPGAAWLALLLWPLLAGASPPLTAQAQRWLKAYGPLRFAPDSACPPLAYYRANAQLAGITPEIPRVIADKLDATVVPVRFQRRTDALASLNRGEADPVGSLSRTTAQAQLAQIQARQPEGAPPGQPRKIPDWVWQGMVALGGVLVFFVIWNYALRSLVVRRTQALRESEARYRSLVDAAPDGILVLRQDRIVFANPAAGRLLGAASLAELQHANLAHLLAPAERPSFKLFLDKLAAENGPRHTEATIARPDGQVRLLEVIGIGVHFEAQRAAQVVMRDITERKRAEDALRQSQASLAAAQKIARLGSWESRLQPGAEDLRRTLAWSDEVFRIFGYQPGQVQPSTEHFYHAVHPDDRDRVRQAVQAAIRLGRPYDLDHRILLPDGSERIVHEQAELQYEPGTGRPLKLVGTVQDITESRRAAETQAKLEAQLRQSQKMEAISQLAGGIAHDFNNILTVILGHSCLLADDPRLTPETRELVRQIAEAAGRAANLTRQLLAFSRQQVMQVCRLNLNETLANIYKMLNRLLGEQIALQCNYAPELPCVEADVGMIEQVIMNLAVNARDAMPKGGRLTISTAVQEISPDSARRNADTHPGCFVTLTVADTGCGMDRATLGRLFEPFFTTKEIGKGTGLGLATVYGIVKQHNGWLQVASVVGGGSTFEVFLPAGATPDAGAPAEAPAHPPAQGHETILVVEDEMVVRHLVLTCLNRCGYQVLEAANGVEALEVWRRHEGKIDLLLTDMVMPEGLTGRDLAERLRARQPALKVIYTTGYSPEMIGATPFLRPGANYLPKPFDPETLARMVRECLDRP